MYPRKHPHETADFGALENMHIGVHPHAIAKTAISLHIAECADAQVESGGGVFPHDGGRAGFQLLAELRALI